MTYAEETLKIAEERADNLKRLFLTEVKHLLDSGAVDPENHNRGCCLG